MSRRKRTPEPASAEARESASLAGLYVKRPNEGYWRLIAPCSCARCHGPLNGVASYVARMTSPPPSFAYYHVGCAPKIDAEAVAHRKEPADA